MEASTVNNGNHCLQKGNRSQHSWSPSEMTSDDIMPLLSNISGSLRFAWLAYWYNYKIVNYLAQENRPKTLILAMPTVFFYKLMKQHKNSILLICPYQDLSSTSDWLCYKGNSPLSVRSTTQI